MPSENMIYADVDGNIGWIASGMMPKRSWSGMLPVPGDGHHEWSGFLSVDQLPQAYNPSNGFIATANHNILPPGYTTPISYEWASRYRIDRIKQVLGSGSHFTVADFQKLQHDDLSLLAQALVPALVDAAKRRGASDRSEVRELASWDFHMSREKRAPLVFEAWSTAFTRLIYGAIVPREAMGTGGVRADVEQVEAIVHGKSLGGAKLPQPTIDSLALGALDEAVSELTTKFGEDRSRWLWGAVPTAPFNHPLSRTKDLPAVSRGGDGNTVYATGGRDYHQTAGASYREIIDLANFDNSMVTNVPGQSARPGSEYYGDLLALWGKDQYFPLVYSRARVEQETKHVLKLQP
jgi:penicillin amidase